MITEYENEPIPGLPGELPTGEHLLWQGAPDWQRLAFSAFHVRSVAAYFFVLAVVALLSGGSTTGIGMTLAVGAAGVALLLVLAWASARTTVYTLTSRRIVLRIGIALPTCINLPLALISSVDLAKNGDVALHVSGKQRLGYLALWPHARPWHLGSPEPMLRGLAGGEAVALRIAAACRLSGTVDKQEGPRGSSLQGALAA